MLLLLAVPGTRHLTQRALAVGSAAAGARVVITSPEGRLVRDARRDGDVVVHGPLGDTVVRFAGGEVWIERAPCPQRLCQRMGHLQGPPRSLVCLPNRIVVRFLGRARDVDAVTR